MLTRIIVIALCLTGSAFGQAGSSGSRRADATTRVLSANDATEGDAQPSAHATTQREFRLLATNKTSTMQKELNEAGTEGFTFVGVTVGETAIAGREVVSILRRPALR